MTRASAGRAPERTWRVQPRFAAIWVAMSLLIVFCAIFAPRSLQPSTFLAIAPLAAFLAIAACGEALVLMGRGIDLSTPAVITLTSTLLLGLSRGRDEAMGVAIAAAVMAGLAVGFVNGVVVAMLRLNALIVTLAVAAIVNGLTLWYRQSLPAEARVPPALAEFGGARWLGVNVSIWVAIAVVAILAVALSKTVPGRRFIAVGANPRAAAVAGINVVAFQAAAFSVAGALYGLTGVLLAAFIRNPTMRVGEPYLLAPIAAAVLGGTAIRGGIGSMASVAAAAVFLTQLGQATKMLGLSTASQFIIYGFSIGIGMMLAESKYAIGEIWRRLRVAPPIRLKSGNR
jgi:ribose transport system permease protein